MLGLFFLTTQQMFELISATGWDAAIHKTKQMPRTPGEHGFWVSTTYVDVLTNTKAQVKYVWDTAGYAMMTNFIFN